MIAPVPFRVPIVTLEGREPQRLFIGHDWVQWFLQIKRGIERPATIVSLEADLPAPGPEHDGEVWVAADTQRLVYYVNSLRFGLSGASF